MIRDLNRDIWKALDLNHIFSACAFHSVWAKMRLEISIIGVFSFSFLFIRLHLTLLGNAGALVRDQRNTKY